MNIATLFQNATGEEAEALARVINRANAMPAVVVTLREGGKSRRYVVDQADESDFDNGRVPHWFGGQWLRGYGRVDEMYRSLCGDEVVKVERLDRAKVWGR